MNKVKRRAVAVRSRFLDDDVYRAEVLALADSDATRETDERRQGKALADDGRWDR